MTEYDRVAKYMFMVTDILRSNEQIFKMSASFDSRVSIQDHLSKSLKHQYEPEVIEAVSTLLKLKEKVRD